MEFYLQSTWYVFHRSIKTRACRAVIHFRIVWHQVFTAKLGQKQEPHSVVSWPFWSHHKLHLHVRGERGQQGCCFTISPPPVCTYACTHTHTNRGQFLLYSVSSRPCASQALLRVECRLVSVVWQRGIILLSQTADRVCTCLISLFSSVFSLWGLCLRAALHMWLAQSRFVKELVEGLRSLAQTNSHGSDLLLAKMLLGLHGGTGSNPNHIHFWQQRQS